MSEVKEELWLHIPTCTLAVVNGNFGQFKWNGKMEESFWGLFRKVSTRVHGWKKIGDL